MIWGTCDENSLISPFASPPAMADSHRQTPQHVCLDVLEGNEIRLGEDLSREEQEQASFENSVQESINRRQQSGSFGECEDEARRARRVQERHTISAEELGVLAFSFLLLLSSAAAYLILHPTC